MVDGGSNGNDTQGYSKVLTLGSVHAEIQLGITICRFIELSNPTINDVTIITSMETSMLHRNLANHYTVLH